MSKVVPGEAEESMDSFDEAVKAFDEDYEKEIKINREKFKGLVVAVPDKEENEIDEFADEQRHHEDLKREGDEEDTEIPSESRISKQMSEQITKVVVSLVLIMLFVTPVLQLDTYVEAYLYHTAALGIATDTYSRGFEDGPIPGSWYAY